LLYINRKLFSSLNLNFIKGTLHTQQKKFQRMNSPTILDGLHNARCCSFHCVHVILDAAKICMDKHKDFIIFYILGWVKRILEFWFNFYRNSRSWSNPCSVICEYEFALKIWEPQWRNSRFCCPNYTIMLYKDVPW